MRNDTDLSLTHAIFYLGKPFYFNIISLTIGQQVCCSVI